MKSLFDPADYAGITTRIQDLPHNATRLWGTMDAAQMLAHCVEPLRMGIGELKVKGNFFGKLIGGLVKKGFLSEKPFKPGLPTAKDFVVADAKNFAAEKERLLSYVKRFYEGGEKGITTYPHAFFGKLTPQQWAESQWKHLDHHLRQFGG